MRRFILAAVAAGVPLTALTADLALRPGGDSLTDLVRDAGQSVSALAAVVSCGLMAAKTSARTRWAWGLFAASASSALAGELGEAVSRFWLHADASFPSIADVGILGAVPLAIAGLLAFPGAPNQFATRWRAALDLAMVALSLTFISGALSLPQAYLAPGSSPLLWVGPAFPVADVAIITAIFVSLRRSVGTQGGRLLLVVGGLAIIAVSDNVAALLSASGSLATLAYVFGAGSMYGYTMVALRRSGPSTGCERSAAISHSGSRSSLTLESRLSP